MKSKALILIALVLALSVFAKENSKNEIKDDEPLHTNTYIGYGDGGDAAGVGGGGGAGAGGGDVAGAGVGGAAGVGGGGGGGAGSYSAGISHGGVYGGGQICKFGCCSESFGYSHVGGGYYSCICCATAAEAKAYRESQPKFAETKN